jgi:hypothetical protein
VVFLFGGEVHRLEFVIGLLSEFSLRDLFADGFEFLFGELGLFFFA